MLLLNVRLHLHGTPLANGIANSCQPQSSAAPKVLAVRTCVVNLWLLQAAEDRMARLVHDINDNSSRRNVFCLFFEAITDIYDGVCHVSLLLTPSKVYAPGTADQELYSGAYKTVPRAPVSDSQASAPVADVAARTEPAASIDSNGKGRKAGKGKAQPAHRLAGEQQQMQPPAVAWTAPCRLLLSSAHAPAALPKPKWLLACSGALHATQSMRGIVKTGDYHSLVRCCCVAPMRCSLCILICIGCRHAGRQLHMDVITCRRTFTHQRS